MDSLGTLDLAWVQGYDGGKAEFIDRNVICFKCGKHVKFIDENGKQTVLKSPGDGIGPLAVHQINKMVAFADLNLQPKIYVYQYPTMREISALEGGAELEFNCLAFSASEYLASLSSLPEFKLTIWNFISGEKLCHADLSNHQPTSVSFNLANWRQLCVTTRHDLTVWNVEQCDKNYIIKSEKLRLPPDDWTGPMDDDRDDEILTRASTRMSKMTIELPRNTIAGVMGDQADKFQDYQDDKVKVVPVSHCWTPSGDIYVGCEGGQLLKVLGESYHMSVIYNPGPRSTTSLSLGPSGLKLNERQESNISEEVGFSPSAGFANTLGEGAFHCMALHKRGLFAAGEDGTLRQFSLERDELNLIESLPLGQDVTSLSFNQTYAKLAIGNSKGSVSIYDPNDPGNCAEFMDTHFGNFVGMDVLAPGTEFVASVREDGEVQIWDLHQPALVSSCPISLQAVSLACSPLSHIVAIGTRSGHLYILDFNQLKSPRIVYREHIHSGPLNHLTFESFGQVLVTGSDDGHVFLLDGRASKSFRILGHTDVPGEVKAISTYTADITAPIKVVVSSSTSNQKREGATKLIQMDITRAMLQAEDMKPFYANLKKEFDEEAVNKMGLNFSVASYGAAVTAGNTVFSLAQNTKRLHKLALPTEKPKKASSKDSFLHANEDAIGHQLPGGRVFMSPHHKWVASGGSDGQLHVRTLAALDRAVIVAPHDFRSGGIHTCAFSADAQYMLTAGYDGVMACFKWNFSGSGASKGKSAVDSMRSRQMSLLSDMKLEDEVVMSLPDWAPPSVSSRPQTTTAEEKETLDKEEAMLSDQIYSTPTPVPSADATWLDVVEIEAIKEEDKAYSDLKLNLRTEIRDMRRQLQGMMRENEDLPDIEKLGHQEFDLDIEEQNRLQAEGEAEVAKIREEKEFENLATMYLREVIKKDCWDDMVVKGRALQAFQREMVVQNYPMRKRPEEEVEELAKVTLQRKVEVAELQARKDIAELTGKPAGQLQSDDDLNEGDEDEGKEHPSITGSLAAKYGGGNELFYSQFELHTREQKMNQIVLLQDAIHRIKMTFNKEFDEVFSKKEQEMAKVKDKNSRIRKILDDLDLQEEVWEPGFTIDEKPDQLLTVNDDEVKVEKFLTAEQRKQLEKEEKEDEERRLREKGDNARERALDMMMGGVLEVKKEDELKKDVPVPAFMQNKAEDDWSEDEKKLAQEYEKKVKELQEERDKYKKQLETELKKLQTYIQEGCSMFDDTLKALFDRKIKTEMVIFQEELKIMRLKYSLLLEEELNTREAELNRLLDSKKDAKHASASELNESKKYQEQSRENYDILSAEDKVMDKQFKREFHDCTALQVDQLYKLFRRRPRGKAAPLKGSSSDTPVFDSTSNNPFADRPSTARQNELAKAALHAALAELDKMTNAPEGLEPHVWERMCRLRRQKIESEQLLRHKALVLADMQAFVNKRQEEYEMLKNDIEELEQSINKLKDDRMRFTCNLEVQLLLKQGQVEVDAGPFIHDYRHSILIHRGVVEDLNGRIRQLGESKISSMVESKDFRKGIIQLEWEHKRMIMEMEDLQNKMRDIQNLKVTREIQAFLNEDDHDAKKAQEIAILEQTIALQKQHHEKNVNERKRILKELRRTIREKSHQNETLEDGLSEINVSVSERRHIHEVNKDKRSDAGAEKRYREIVQRRKLVDLAKAQAQEVAVLRAEVERLRMRTFPALVQVEH